MTILIVHSPTYNTSNRPVHPPLATDFVFMTTSSSAIAERPRFMVGWFWPKMQDWDWETIFCRNYRSVFTHCNV